MSQQRRRLIRRPFRQHYPTHIDLSAPGVSCYISLLLISVLLEIRNFNLGIRASMYSLSLRKLTRVTPATEMPRSIVKKGCQLILQPTFDDSLIKANLI